MQRTCNSFDEANMNVMDKYNCEKRNAKKNFRIYYLKLKKYFILICF